jgi:hypothetical protein
MIRSSLLDRFALEDSIEVYFVFFEFYFIYYGFLKYIQISRILNQKMISGKD